MISIQTKEKCCGCSACVQRCPKQCISLREDEEGFLYPKVSTEMCISCGLCEKVCPVHNQTGGREPLAVYAAKNPDLDVRKRSSSGGIFTLLAERTIEQGGVVFGACFDDKWSVVHQCAETKSELAKFRGSKYVQSRVGETFRQTEALLKQGRKVLYSGTPCQIAGLRLYLRNDWDNLLTVDFICHGVPSPGVFRTYLRDELKKAAQKGGKKNTVLPPCIPLVTENDGLGNREVEIKSINFRDKRNGWKKFGFALVLSKAFAAGEKNSVLLSYESLNKNSFLRGFLRDLYLRPSCYACPVRRLKSGSDVTIGDFWGIASLAPELDDDEGVSAVIINTENGKKVVQGLNMSLQTLPYSELAKRNPALINSAALPKSRSKFFKADGKTFEEKIKSLAKVRFSLRNLVLSIGCRLLPKKLKNGLKRILRKQH